MTELLFFIAISCVFYVYAGYPLLALLLGAISNRRVASADNEPFISILIAAYNEADAIEATVRNKLALDYPQDRLEVIVISDGSSDRTDTIVRAIADPRLRLIRQEPRAGKTSALNLAVPQAKGEIIVFSDANSIYAPETIRLLAAAFVDPAVGYVTGRMIYADPDGTPIGAGCSAYMRYENMLRDIETRLGSVVGVDGGIDAVRTALYRPMNADQLPDFVLPLKVVEQGYRVVFEPRALLWENSLKAAADEYKMRVRVSLRAFWALYDMRVLLLPWGSPLFAWQLWSHKVMRYLCFIPLGIAFGTNALLFGTNLFFSSFFLIQAAAYLAALIAPLVERSGISNSLLSFARYFLLLNVASAHAFCKFLTGKKQVLWTPRKG